MVRLVNYKITRQIGTSKWECTSPINRYSGNNWTESGRCVSPSVPLSQPGSVLGVTLVMIVFGEKLNSDELPAIHAYRVHRADSQLAELAGWKFVHF